MGLFQIEACKVNMNKKAWKIQNKKIAFASQSFDGEFIFKKCKAQLTQKNE
jgi:hypothetical protein